MPHGDLIPRRLKFEMGAYQAAHYIIEWGDGRLFYAIENVLPGLDRKDTIPTESQWEEFWETVEDAKVWHWASSYTAPVIDGTTWSLDIQHGNKSIHTSGHMAGPDPEDFNKGVGMKEAELLKALIRGLNNLCGTVVIPELY